MNSLQNWLKSKTSFSETYSPSVLILKPDALSVYRWHNKCYFLSFFMTLMKNSWNGNASFFNSLQKQNQKKSFHNVHNIMHSTEPSYLKKHPMILYIFTWVDAFRVFILFFDINNFIVIYYYRLLISTWRSYSL